jgi:PAS domain S-box-containing protein
MRSDVSEPEPPPLVAALDRAVAEAGRILELLPVATWICDPETRIVQYNRRAAEIWGREPAPGESHEQFTAASRFYDADGQVLQQSAVRSVLQTGEPVRDAEVVVERPNGTRIVVLLNIEPLRDGEGRIVGAINCIQDITERKRVSMQVERQREELREQQERWNATYEHAAIGIVEIDAEGRFLRVNQAICNIIGRTREELLGWRLFASTHPADRDHDEELYRRQVRGDLEFYSVEKRFIRGDGRIVWCAIRSSTVRDETGRFLYSVRVVQDVTERKEAEERQKVMIDELNHRVKNTLATVQSLATQTARGTSSPEEFRQAFEGRLIAVSHAHDQLTRRHWRNADLRDIVTATTAPYLAPANEQIEIEGESITLTPRASLTLALAFHELTTNASKYGALSRPAGRIDVRWQIDASAKPERLRIEWRERGGPPVSPPERRGFGSRFIEGSVAAELHGTARIDFDPQGLRCTMDIPFDPAAKARPS